MFELSVYARTSIERLFLFDELGHHKLIQVLLYALEQILEFCKYVSDIWTHDVCDFDPFPEEFRISIIMAKYLSQGGVGSNEES